MKYSDLKEDADAKTYDKVEVIYNRSDLPPVNYEVKLTDMPTSLFINNNITQVIDAGRTDIIDVKKNNRIIAFNKAYRVQRDFIGMLGRLNTPPYGPKLGIQDTKHFVFFRVFSNEYARDVGLVGYGTRAENYIVKPRRLK